MFQSWSNLALYYLQLKQSIIKVKMSQKLHFHLPKKSMLIIPHGQDK